jgi:hypothetical protein
MCNCTSENPSARKLGWEMDSGFALRAPRNDDNPNNDDSPNIASPYDDLRIDHRTALVSIRW